MWISVWKFSLQNYAFFVKFCIDYCHQIFLKWTIKWATLITHVCHLPRSLFAEWQIQKGAIFSCWLREARQEVEIQLRSSHFGVEYISWCSCDELKIENDEERQFTSQLCKRILHQTPNEVGNGTVNYSAHFL
jgi:hypothetical protein